MPSLNVNTRWAAGPGTYASAGRIHAASAEPLQGIRMCVCLRYPHFQRQHYSTGLHRPQQPTTASTPPARPIYRSPLRPPLRRTFDSHSPSRGSSSSVRSSHLELTTPYTADGRRRRTPDSRSDPAVVHHRRPRTRKTSPRKLKDVSDAAGGPPVGGHAAASRGAAAAAK